MKYTLRPYQAEANAAIMEEFKKVTSTLLVLPTGGGKTQCFSDIAEKWEVGRVLVMAHRIELIEQAAEKLKAATGEEPEIEMASLRAAEELAGSSRRSKCVVTSVQTMSKDKRLSQYSPWDFGLVIVDESHRGLARTYRKVLDHFKRNSNLKILCVTATPDRADGEALGQICDSVAYQYEISQAIEDGWLVPLEVEYIIIREIDYTKCRTLGGDFQQNDLEKVWMPAAGIDRSKQLSPEEEVEIQREEKISQGVVDETIRRAGDKKTLVFASSVAHAVRIAEIFNRHKPGSAHAVHSGTEGIPGNTKEERVEIVKQFRRGDFQYLVNFGIFTEGFDVPDVGCVVLARGTKSRSLFSQMVGRGTRPLPGLVDDPNLDSDARRAAIAASSKPSLLLLDFTGITGRHKLVGPEDLLGGNYTQDIIDMAADSAKKKSAKGERVDVGKELKAAQLKSLQEAAARRAHIIAKSQSTSRKVDVFDLFDIPNGYEPVYSRGKQATERMKDAVRRAGVNPEGLTYHQTKQIIIDMHKRREQGLCTHKQGMILRNHGIDPVNVSFDKAGAMLDLILTHKVKEVPPLTRDKWRILPRKDGVFLPVINLDSGRYVLGGRQFKSEADARAFITKCLD